jgi:hypothetical protein
MTSDEDNSHAEPGSAVDVVPAPPQAYTSIGYVAPMHLRAWKHCYSKFIDEKYLNTTASLIRDEYKKLKMATPCGWPSRIAHP